MKERSFRITLKNPCSQNWDDMPQVSGGMYCSQCSKVVTDFTHLSDEALIELLSKKNSGDICGKFYNRQLDKVYLLQTTRPQRSFHSLKLILAGLLTLRLPAEAQTQPVKHNTVIKADQKKPALKPQPLPKSIKGQVTDARTRKGIYATVNLCTDKESYNFNEAVETDEHGNYEIPLPDEGLARFFRIRYYSEAYAGRDIIVDRDKAPAWLPVSLPVAGEYPQGLAEPMRTTGGVPEMHAMPIEQDFVGQRSVMPTPVGTPEQKLTTTDVKLPFYKRVWAKIKRALKNPASRAEK